ncbi:cell wall-associated NlpC family hydrolase [Ruminiclostridium sufflavum DSM 19573]|uniref:Cell wall-associated NlpC family hydrolase n=1 Tax=Ruminiclostridium sufflavum DSM 19573 TaxID=1121337 RepID=A0A318XQ83_9FIRM|nr:C40 family peptidase [Ruminiclostridium sufflavum]PYG89345.1 cell wall-associated NlpC family hydrolase [Ruminiclostridium sufflavum DSM 19573]
MVDPVLIAKAAATLLSDEKIRKGIGWTIAAILSPVVVILIVIFGMLSGGADHNNKVLDLCFHGGVISGNVPEDYRKHIEDMRSSFTVIDEKISAVNARMENGDSLDSIRVKAVFYSLYFGSDQPFMLDSSKYINCFVTYEQRTRTVKKSDGTASRETYTVAVPIKDMFEVYKKINFTLGKTVDYKEMSNANEIYYRIAYGIPAPLEDDSTEGWDGWTYQLSAEEKEKLQHNLPAGSKGGEIVKYALSRLGNPYSQEKRGIERYTDCSYLAMWCYRQAGIYIPGTAAEQGKFCAENELTISKNFLLPGDLVFWSYRPNGRFMNITHVGIYAGDGKVIDASSSEGMVVYRDLFNSNKQVLYGRPHIKK